MRLGLWVEIFLCIKWVDLRLNERRAFLSAAALLHSKHKIKKSWDLENHIFQGFFLSLWPQLRLLLRLHWFALMTSQFGHLDAAAAAPAKLVSSQTWASPDFLPSKNRKATHLAMSVQAWRASSVFRNSSRNSCTLQLKRDFWFCGNIQNCHMVLFSKVFFKFKNLFKAKRLSFENRKKEISVSPPAIWLPVPENQSLDATCI